MILPVERHSNMESTRESEPDEALRLLQEKLEHLQILAENRGGSCRLLLTDYFYSLRNDFDIEFEELILRLKESCKESESCQEDTNWPCDSDDERNDDWPGCQALGLELRSLDRLRKDLFAEINRNERECLDACQDVEFVSSLNARFEPRIQDHRAFIHKNDQLDLDSIQDRMKCIEKDHHELRTALLQNKSFFMKKFPYSSSLVSGVELNRLIVVDHSLNENQVNFMR